MGSPRATIPLGVGAIAVVAACSPDPLGSSLAFERAGLGGLVWGGEQKVVSSDAAELDEFGVSVAVTTDHAVVGAYGDDFYRGAAYVFVKTSNSWSEEQKLVASDGAEGDSFGHAVSLAGDRALVAAYAADAYRGAVYVFVKSGNAWIEEQKLVASDGVAGDNFGYTVSLAGERALVGAYWDDNLRGAVYSFIRSGSATRSSWTQEQKLVASDGSDGDRFGNAISLAGDGVLIGAFGAGANRGAAYVFARNGGPWSEQQRLVASDGLSPDLFGWSVGLAAGQALIGANYV